MLVGRAKDTRLMVVYGYARLVGYDRQLDLEPDILESVDVEDGRIFTLHLRKGHRWSDGEPFTSEDFRYWWEDVANNEALEPDRAADRCCMSTARRRRSSSSTRPRSATAGRSPIPFFLPALARRRRCSSTCRPTI